MIKEFIGIGKTIDAATQAAKAGLNAPLTADVHIEVVEMPKSKILGIFGGRDAKVKASYDDGVKEKKTPKKQQKKQGAKPTRNNDTPKANAPKTAQKPEQKPASKSEPKKDRDKDKDKEKDFPKSVDLDLAKSYLAQILEGLKVNDAKISAAYESGVITIDIDCEDCGIIIGHHGDTLDSIQYLLSLIMKKNSGGYVRVSINIGDFRERRNETLRNLAKKHAAYVLRTGRSYKFDPMNPYERRIIHTTVQDIDGVESRSVGYNQDRRIILEPTGGVKPRTNSNPRRGRGAKPAAPQVDPDREHRVDRADLPKFGKIEVNKN